MWMTAVTCFGPGGPCPFGWQVGTPVLTVFPFTHSVAKELEAMAEPQPNVLNRASTIFPFSST